MRGRTVRPNLDLLAHPQEELAADTKEDQHVVDLAGVEVDLEAAWLQAVVAVAAKSTSPTFVTSSLLTLCILRNPDFNFDCSYHTQLDGKT
jgi:hypothetical protein